MQCIEDGGKAKKKEILSICYVKRLCVFQLPTERLLMWQNIAPYINGGLALSVWFSFWGLQLFFVGFHSFICSANYLQCYCVHSFSVHFSIFLFLLNQIKLNVWMCVLKLYAKAQIHTNGDDDEDDSIEWVYVCGEPKRM